MIAAYMPMIDMAHPLSGSSGGEGSSEEDERPQACEAAGSGGGFDTSAEAEERARDELDPRRSWSPSDLLASGGESPVAPAQDAEMHGSLVADGGMPAGNEPVRRCTFWPTASRVRSS